MKWGRSGRNYGKKEVEEVYRQMHRKKRTEGRKIKERPID